MSKLTTEEVAEIKSALQVIQENAKLIGYPGAYKRPNIIIEQVKRIDKLLPEEKK